MNKGKRKPIFETLVLTTPPTRGVARILFRKGNIFGGRPRGGGPGPEPPGPQRYFENFLRKAQKMHYLAYFTQSFTNIALLFRALGRKTQIVGKI